MVERVLLRDGAEAFVWPSLPTDKDALSQEYEHLSPGSRYHRFHAEIPHLTSQMLGHLVDEVNGVNHAAWVLCTLPDHGPEALAGLARIIRYPHKPDTGDVAVTVADDWQGKGVASALVEVLKRHPLEGITTIETCRDHRGQPGRARPAPTPRRHRRDEVWSGMPARRGAS